MTVPMRLTGWKWLSHMAKISFDGNAILEPNLVTWLITVYSTSTNCVPIEENAVNLVYGYLNLSNKFDLKDFDARCQAALVALVSGCPQKAAS